MSTPQDRPIPFWRSGRIHGESLLFIEPAADMPATSCLLFPPLGPVSLQSATGDIDFVEHRDFIVDTTSGVLTRTAGSRIPVAGLAELHPSIDPDGSGFMHIRDNPATFLLVDESGLFHRRQASASYAFDPARWTGYTTAFAGASMPGTLERLRRRDPLTLCVIGDSISEGYNASGFIGVPPFQPPYATLVSNGLEQAYQAPVTLRNLALAGWTADNGAGAVDDVAAVEPHLVVIAFGMNDAGYAAEPHYAANVRAMVEGIRQASPRSEFVLVSSMLPNPDWHYPQAERFADYRQGLTDLCGPGIILADMTTLWADVMARKSPYDLTGNGINHPNDFGHRLYAQAILSLLIE